jgi:hypothetical protein
MIFSLFGPSASRGDELNHITIICAYESGDENKMFM